jgi:hypothetical protein
MSLEVRRTAAPPFESQQNQNMLCQVLTNDFKTRGLGALSPEEGGRLSRMVSHYAKEVKRVQGAQPITILNKEVLKACAKQIIVSRQETTAAPIRSLALVDEDAVDEDEGDIVAALGMSNQSSTTAPDNLFQDTSKRFEVMQQSRNDLMKRDTPNPPDFRVSLEEDKQLTSPFQLFEAAKAARDRETVAADAAALAKNPLNTVGPLGELYGGNTTGLASAARPPLGDTRPRLPDRDPALIIRGPEPSLPQDILTRKDDVLTYKENEFNLFVNSIDRNWYQDSDTRFNETQQNRYNFVVNFDPANNRQGLGITPASQRKFRNIVRIELVKVIMPNECIDAGVTVLSTGNFEAGTTYTPLKLPYVTMRVDELEGNNYGTTNDIDNAFALVHYDGKWGESASAATGFIDMIPKFLKAQREYRPTPLSTLQKLTIHLNRPDGTSVSPTQDVYNIQKLYFNSFLPLDHGSTANDSPFAVTLAAGEVFVFLETPGFDASAFAVGDRVNLQGLLLTDTGLGSATDRSKFMSFINRKEGHAIVGIMTPYITSGVYDYTSITDGYFGYYNTATTLIIQLDKETLTTYPDYHTSGFAAALALTDIGSTKVINTSHQVQCVFRVITRELDAASRVRPDNL